LILDVITLFLQCDVDIRDLPSFPTRRSSDLLEDDCVAGDVGKGLAAAAQFVPGGEDEVSESRVFKLKQALAKVFGRPEAEDFERSEEHTSELQSQSNLVCRLLLEKKKRTR